jgi:hypothetical protein
VQGPGSSAADSDREPPATAKTEIIFSTLALWHFLQVTCRRRSNTTVSNCSPQSWQRYSKRGMGNLAKSRKCRHFIAAGATMSMQFFADAPASDVVFSRLPLLQSPRAAYNPANRS